MADKTWLALTAGRTDIKLLVNEHLYEIDRGVVAFHHWLKDNPDQITFKTLSEKTKSDKKDFVYDHHAKSEAKLGDEVISNQSIELVLPKLSKIIQTLKEDENKSILGAIVYYSDRQGRDCGRVADAEPFYVGQVIARYLQETFEFTALENGQVPEANKTLLVNYLAQDCKYDGSGNEYPIAFSVTSLLEKPLYELSKQSDIKLVYSDMGGQPEIKRNLRATLGLLFNKRHEIWIDSQESDDEKEGFKSPSVSHELSLMVRGQCVALLEMGSVEEAWALAKPFAKYVAKPVEKYAQEKEWVAHVDYLRRLLGGTLRYPDLYSPELKDMAYYDSLRSFSTPLIPRALVHALRAQAALKTQNNVVAIASTYSVDEAAMFDAISIWLHRNGFDIDECIRDFTQEINYKAESKTESYLLKKFIDNFGKANLFKRSKIAFAPLHKDDFIDGLTTPQIEWLDICRIDGLKTTISAISKKYRDMIPLKKLNVPANSSVSYLDKVSCSMIRNSLAHGLPEKDIISIAPQAFGSVGIWKNTPKGYYQVLFDNSPVSNILSALGVNHAEKLYNDIINGVCDALKAYDPYQPKDE